MSSSTRKSRRRSEARSSLASSVTILPGVGARRADLLKQLGIETIGDLLLHAPHRYIDRSTFCRIADLTQDSIQTVVARVSRVEIKRIKGRHTTVVHFDDGSARLACLWFNQPYLRNVFRPGSVFVLSGKVRKSKFGASMFHPEYEPFGKDLVHTGRLVPVYPTKPGISQKQIRRLIRMAIDLFAHSILDLVPASITSRLGLRSLGDAIARIHYPGTPDEAEDGRKRLAFDEALLMQTIFAMMRVEKEHHQAECHLRDVNLDYLVRFLPFRLTSSQQAALEVILDDLASRLPMRRLLLGDVGCGKTVVASLAAATVGLGGGQVALMCPTEILAEQHFRTLSRYLFPFGINVGLLTGSMAQPERRSVETSLATGEVKAVVGTHALLGENVGFKNLELIIVDEEQRFGVVQRSRLVNKAPSANLLVLTATPIPRTMALAVYGDLDVTVIHELPPGRGTHTTTVVEEHDRKSVLEHVAQRIREGEQGFLICPALEESDHGLANVASVASEMRNLMGSKAAVAVLTGRTERRQRERILREFASKRIGLIVATTVVEVGMDIESATILVVEQADRFGLSQLHQMRGRVARGSKDSVSYFIISESASEIAKQRLKVLEETFDGFRVAEHDLAMRGPGDLVGTRQHGVPDLKFARLPDDSDLMLAARDEAFRRTIGGVTSPEWEEWMEAVRGFIDGRIVLV